MSRVAAFACGLVITVQSGFAQTEPPRQSRDTTMLADTLTYQPVSADSIQHPDSSAYMQREFPRPTKITIDEDRVFDLSTQPIHVGEKEFTSIPLGKRWETDFVERPPTNSGRFVAAYGNYSTPRVSGWVSSASPKSNVLLRLKYRSSEGPGEYRDVRSAFAEGIADWYLQESAGWFSNGRVNTTVAFEANRYRLYGSITPSQERTSARLDGEATISAAGDGFKKASVSFSALRMDDTQRTEELSAGLTLAAGEMVHRTLIRGELNVWKDFRTTSLGKSHPLFVSLGGGVKSRLGNSVDLTAGVKLYHVQGSPDAFRWRVVPQARIEWYATHTLTVFAGYEPFVRRRTLAGFLRTNTFVHAAAVPQSTDAVVNASAGCAVGLAGVVKASASLNYLRAHAYPVFSVRPENLWDVTYTVTSRSMFFESEVFAEPGSSLVGMKLRIHDTRTEVDIARSIPYVPKVELTATLQHAVQKSFRVATDIRYTGRRFADEQNTRRLPHFVLWDVSVEFGERVLFGAGVTNILDRKEGEWEGYAGEPRRVMLSLGYTW